MNTLPSLVVDLFEILDRADGWVRVKVKATGLYGASGFSDTIVIRGDREAALDALRKIQEFIFTGEQVSPIVFERLIEDLRS